MENQIVFKTSAFGGFEKKAVLDYIYKLNEDTETLQSDLRRQLESATGERQTLSEDLHRANERIKSLQQNLDNSNAELVGERARVSELGNLNEGLQEELERDRERLRQREQELEKLISENRTLKAKNDEFSAKQAEINETVSRIGQLMLDARSDADEMIKNAEAEAARLRQQAEAQAADLRREAEEQAKLTLSDAEASSQQTLEEADRKSTAILLESQQKSGRIMAESRRSVETVTGSMGDLKTEMDQVRSLISHLFTQLEQKTIDVNRSIDTAVEILAGAENAVPSAKPVSGIATQPESTKSEPSSEKADAPQEEPVDDPADCFFRGAAEA